MTNASLFIEHPNQRGLIMERDWERERDRYFEIMPPPGSQIKEYAAPLEIEQPIDPNEPIYCVCHQVSFGDMIACDNANQRQVSLFPPSGYHSQLSHQCPSCTTRNTSGDTLSKQRSMLENILRALF